MTSTIAHLTSVHQRYDTRIFIKQTQSLARNGYSITLVVADGLGEETKEGVRFLDVGKSAGRVDRIFNASRRVYAAARRLEADVYQIHDPELIPVGLALRLRGARVIFDAHEDLPKQLLSKPYLNGLVARVLSISVKVFEWIVCRFFSAILTATPSITRKFQHLHSTVYTVNNYPIDIEFAEAQDWCVERSRVCYIGAISEIRGIRQLVQSMEQTKVGMRLDLIGGFSPASLESEVEDLPGWRRIDYHGFVSRNELPKFYRQAAAGLVTFLPMPNHVDAQPNKLFEYMAAGIPIIASDFELWRLIVIDNDCGVCVDPEDPAAIANAIQYLADNPDVARRMGDNGRRAVAEKYNWAAQEKTLLQAYEKVLDNNDS